MCSPDPDHPQSAATFRWHGGLQELLARRCREGALVYHFRDHPGVKDAIEALGVPHTEVDILLVNGRSVGFDYQLRDGDAIEVFPAGSPAPVAPLSRLSPEPPLPAAFVIDVHLGKLARRLRLLGFDCLYDNNFSDAAIMRLSREQGRIILTRDRGILKHRQVVHGYLLRSERVAQQVEEVLVRYHLCDRIRPWLRCMACNGLLETVDKATVTARLEAKTRRYYDDFRGCPDCRRLYWRGSHVEKIERWLDALLAPGKRQPPG